jgi:PAS domain S-box-containing protein
MKRLDAIPGNDAALIEDIDSYLAPFRASGQRIYRTIGDEIHSVSFIQLMPGNRGAIETGFSYTDYRRYIHESTIHLLYLLGGVIIVLLVLFPLFFLGVLIRPMRGLLEGMRMVNSGNLDVAVPIRVKDEIGYLTHSFNIMVRSVKNTNHDIDNINHYLKNIIDSMPSMLVGVDSKGRISHWNMAAEKKTGFKEDDVMGRYLWDIMPQFDQYVKNMMKSIDKREPQKFESIVHLENNEIRYSDMMVYPLISNGVEGAVIRIDDITLRRRLEEMMIQTEKMMSVGGLAAGMAHEINNPLSGILLAAQNIARRLSPDFEANREAAEKCGIEFKGLQGYLKARDIVKMLEDMKEMGERASMIVNNMLSFSRQSESKMTGTDLAQLLIKTVDLAASEYDLKKSYDFRHIEIVKEFDTSVPLVKCIAVEIQQVILNLLKNAAHAMHLKKYAPDESPRITLRLNQESEWAVIEVEDNGPGMSDEHRKRVFEPFFTTKESGKGTGLGLSVSYFIITDNHKGRMEVESMPGKGTRFIIHLPTER